MSQGKLKLRFACGLALLEQHYDLIAIVISRGDSLAEQLQRQFRDDDYRVVDVIRGLQPPWPGLNQRRAVIAYGKMAAQGQAGRLSCDLMVVDAAECDRSPWAAALLQAYLAGSKNLCFIAPSYQWQELAAAFVEGWRCFCSALPNFASAEPTRAFRSLTVWTAGKPRQRDAEEMTAALSADALLQNALESAIPYE